MKRLARLICTGAAAAAIVVPAVARAAPDVAASCIVSVDYVVNGAVNETYTRAFAVSQATPFRDDFSAQTRTKTFDATLVKDGGSLTVAIDYFNDFGVFVAIGFNARLTISGGGGLGSTSGGYTFSSSQAIPPGNHATNYALACRRV